MWTLDVEGGNDLNAESPDGDAIVAKMFSLQEQLDKDFGIKIVYIDVIPEGDQGK